MQPPPMPVVFEEARADVASDSSEDVRVRISAADSSDVKLA
jgi:hypothetical protein